MTRDTDLVEAVPLARARDADRLAIDHTREAAEPDLGVWASAKMQAIHEIARQAARTEVTVLITGETGTGKGVIARTVHQLGPRRAGPFVNVNCAAISPELLESELFGHERGAFTGAHQLKIGKFEAANGGTIVLDEIGELHPALQAKLLHVLEDGEISRVGGRSTTAIDVRVIAATNQNLEEAIAAGRFREDLYYRLNVVRIEVPPLRDRHEDIPLLAAHFIERFSWLFHRQPFVLTRDISERLLRHPFPGNVRELETLIKRMILLEDPGRAVNGGETGRPARDGSQALPTTGEPSSHPPLKEVARNAARAAERSAILRALEVTGWNRSRAAKLLKISYRALLGKIKAERLESGIGTSSP